MFDTQHFLSVKYSHCVGPVGLEGSTQFCYDALCFCELLMGKECLWGMMNNNFVLFLVLQIVIWFIMPLNGSSPTHANHSISLIIMVQYLPRLCVIFPLNSKIIRNTGVVAKTAWSGAAYNLLLYLLASHVSSAPCKRHLPS